MNFELTTPPLRGTPQKEGNILLSSILYPLVFLLQDRQNFVIMESVAQTFDEQSEGLSGQGFIDVFGGERRRAVGDENAEAGPLDDDPFLGQLRKYPGGRRRIQAEVFGQLPYRRQPVSRLENLFDDQKFDLKHHLLRQRLATMVIERNFHGNYLS